MVLANMNSLRYPYYLWTINNSTFQNRFGLLHVIRDLISCVINFRYDKFHKLPNDLRNQKIRKLGNIRKILKLNRDRVQCLVPFPEIKFWLQQPKTTLNQISKSSALTAWKVSKYGVFLVQIQEKTDQKKLRI